MSEKAEELKKDIVKPPKAAPPITAKPKRNYPNISLEDCLIVAQKIKELNGGIPGQRKKSQMLSV